MHGAHLLRPQIGWQAVSSGTTSVPLRPFGGTCLSGPFLEGRACHVRLATLNHVLRFVGHDKRAPPTFRRDLLVRSVWLCPRDASWVLGKVGMSRPSPGCVTVELPVRISLDS